MIIIGEKINGTRPDVARAIKDRDSGYITSLARRQAQAGASYLDLNAGTHPEQEPADMVWLVQLIQGAAKAKLTIDSANPQAILAGIEAADSLPMINSLSGEQARVEGVLPLACRYGTELVVLALDDNGIPKTAQERLDIIRRLVGLARDGGLSDEKMYIDPLVTTIATDNASGLIAFETIRLVKKEFPKVHITCGLSNISFGQPGRGVINQAFAPLAMAAGLDSAILDPTDAGLRSVIYAAEMVLGRDPDCQAYSQAHRQGLIGTGAGISAGQLNAIAESANGLLGALGRAGLLTGQPPEQAPAQAGAAGASAGGAEDRLAELVDSLVNMKRDRVAELCDELLAEGADPMLILDASRKGMAEVGKLFEQDEYFVPELVLAGRMLTLISDKVKPLLAADDNGQGKEGRVLIGTVEGDIHDIGKDIVVTMLEVGGYEVLDLGVDVPKERFVEAAQEFKPQVIGLSGFLTLVYDPMKETIAALKQAGLGEVKYMIGGGQMDDHVRQYTGADAYGSDALEAVKLCDGWLGLNN